MDRLALESNLLLISRVQPGQTICLFDRSIVDHRRWFTSLKRSYHGESRTGLINFITKTISAIPTTPCPKWKDLYPLVKRGLKHLQETYAEDVFMTEQLQQLINLIDIMSQEKPTSPVPATVHGLQSFLRLLTTHRR